MLSTSLELLYSSQCHFHVLHFISNTASLANPFLKHIQFCGQCKLVSIMTVSLALLFYLLFLFLAAFFNQRINFFTSLTRCDGVLLLLITIFVWIRFIFIWILWRSICLGSSSLYCFTPTGSSIFNLLFLLLWICFQKVQMILIESTYTNIYELIYGSILSP